MLEYSLLGVVGLAIGSLGTLIGAGGGFILVPMLLLVYRNEAPEIITGISLAVTFANALSGSIAYARMKRISYRYGLWFSAATIPGAIVGAAVTAYIPRQTFNLVFALAMLAAAVALFLRPSADDRAELGGPVRLSPSKLAIGIVISIGVGFVSSLLGIGGGIIHVPVLVRMLGFPVHAATALSHFILVFTVGAGTLEHVVSGEFAAGAWRAAALAAGALVGAQLGAWLSTRVRGRAIIRMLAGGLALVGVRLIVLFFSGR